VPNETPNCGSTSEPTPTITSRTPKLSMTVSSVPRRLERWCADWLQQDACQTLDPLEP
jgi:hypothetical protein